MGRVITKILRIVLPVLAGGSAILLCTQYLPSRNATFDSLENFFKAVFCFAYVILAAYVVAKSADPKFSLRKFFEDEYDRKKF